MGANNGLEFQHHGAQADDEGAGSVVLAMMRYTRVRTPAILFQEIGIEQRRFRGGLACK